MQVVEHIDELDEAQVLDRLDVLHETQRRAECEVLELAVHYAVLHNEHTLDPYSVGTDGREKVLRFGGVGTPLVTEFCPVEFGARLQRSPYAAHLLIADALDLKHRLPQLWRRVQALEVKVSYARYVARKTRDLQPDEAAYVDSRVVEAADGRVTWSRFEDLVAAAVKAADPEAAAEREAKAAKESYARATRCDEHGMRGFYIRADFAIIARLDATIAHLADALEAFGVQGTVDQRRALAVLFLAHPAHALRLLHAYHQANTGQPAEDEADDSGQATADAPAADDEADDLTAPGDLLPGVVLHVHCYSGPEPTGVARVEGIGPISEAWLRKLLGEQARFTVQPVLDIEGQAPVDGYEIPDRHRQAVHLMTPADIHPFATSTARDMQIDHTVPYRHGPDRPAGQSRVGNYGPMTTFHHRVKTFGKWTVKQPFPGIYLWQDPHGVIYLVDHTGTRRIDTAA